MPRTSGSKLCQHDLEDKKHSASRYQDNSFFSTSCGLKSRKHQGVSLTLFLWTQRFRLRPRRRDPPKSPDERRTHPQPLHPSSRYTGDPQGPAPPRSQSQYDPRIATGSRYGFDFRTIPSSHTDAHSAEYSPAPVAAQTPQTLASGCRNRVPRTETEGTARTNGPRTLKRKTTLQILHEQNS
jgi:hypothetical protein